VNKVRLNGKGKVKGNSKIVAVISKTEQYTNRLGYKRSRVK